MIKSIVDTMLQNETDYGVLNACRNKLVALGLEAVPHIVEAIIQNSSSVLRIDLRSSLFWILRNHVSAENLELLSPLLEHENWYVNLTGAEALADLQIGTPRLEKLLSSCLTDECNHELAVSVCSALHSFGTPTAKRLITNYAQDLSQNSTRFKKISQFLKP